MKAGDWCQTFYRLLLDFSKLFSPAPTQPNPTRPSVEPNPRPCLSDSTNFSSASFKTEISVNHSVASYVDQKFGVAPLSLKAADDVYLEVLSSKILLPISTALCC